VSLKQSHSRVQLARAVEKGRRACARPSRSWRIEGNVGKRSRGLRAATLVVETRRPVRALFRSHLAPSFTTILRSFTTFHTMSAPSLHPAPEFLLDDQGCWYISSDPDPAAHTSILPRPLDDVFLATSSPFVFEPVSDDLADYALSLPSFDHLLHSSFPAQWTPSRSLLSPHYLPETYTPNRPTRPAQPQASTLTTPYVVGEALSPWLRGTDPVDRKFPNPFARCPDLEPLFSGRPFSPNTSQAFYDAYTHHHSLSPLTPITNLQVLTPHSSPCPSFGSSFDSSSSLTWSSSSSSPSPNYMNSPSISRYSHPSPVETAAPLLPALQLAGASKKRLSSTRASLTSHKATELCPRRTDRKRKPGSDSGRTFASKRARTHSSDDLSPSSSTVPDEPSRATEALVAGASRRRLFPPGLPINPDFEQMYIRHPVSSFVSGERNG
jgi:hypothetical protein